MLKLHLSKLHRYPPLSVWCSWISHIQSDWLTLCLSSRDMSPAGSRAPGSTAGPMTPRTCCCACSGRSATSSHSEGEGGTSPSLFAPYEENWEGQTLVEINWTTCCRLVWYALMRTVITAARGVSRRLWLGWPNTCGQKLYPSAFLISNYQLYCVLPFQRDL